MPPEKVNRAKELLATVRHASMATVNDDGSLHNTPVYFVVDSRREYFYWASSPQAQHTRNLERTGQAFIAVYETGKGGGLYLMADDAHELAGDELRQGLSVWSAQRRADDKPLPGETLFAGKSPQRLYRLKITRFWVNHSEKDADGNVLCDIRSEISRDDLL